VFNVLLVLLAAPLLDGFLRRVRARIHSRQGPPILQTYYDLAKLMVKEDQRGANNFIFNAAPVACLGSVLLAALFVPMGGVVPLGFAGDILVLIYILTLAPIFLVLGGMASGSPYAYVGVNREIMLLMVVEPVLAVALISTAIKANSLVLVTCIDRYASSPPDISLIIGAIAFFLILQPEISKVPFDLAEAEQEIMEGPLIEYSGRKLALLKWSMYSKQIVLIALFTGAFVPWPRTGFLPADIVIALVKILISAVLVEVIAQVFPRLKINQAIRYFAIVIAVALTGLVLAVMDL
ncbi:MAG: respiratory-chain dehydrogenase subunit 1, partial [Acidobacteria bacterium]|nr:respiratory-chain dehydrogenase subunit 1 [Acidobacteriota bacterium]